MSCDSQCSVALPHVLQCVIAVFPDHTHLFFFFAPVKYLSSPSFRCSPFFGDGFAVVDSLFIAALIVWGSLCLVLVLLCST